MISSKYHILHWLTHSTVMKYNYDMLQFYFEDMCFLNLSVKYIESIKSCIWYCN